jgi:hypothetical protein
MIQNIASAIDFVVNSMNYYCLMIVARVLTKIHSLIQTAFPFAVILITLLNFVSNANNFDVATVGIIISASHMFACFVLSQDILPLILTKFMQFPKTKPFLLNDIRIVSSESYSESRNFRNNFSVNC